MNALVSFEKQCREIPALVLRLLSLMLVTAVSVLFLKIVCQVPSLILSCSSWKPTVKRNSSLEKCQGLTEIGSRSVRGSMKTGVGAMSDSRLLTRGHV